VAGATSHGPVCGPWLLPPEMSSGEQAAARAQNVVTQETVTYSSAASGMRR